MDDRGRYHNLPIPTYEEATSPRPSSSQGHTGPSEISDDAERQGLLGHSTAPNPADLERAGWRQPTVESLRSSLDSELALPEVHADHDEEEEGHISRRDIEEMDFLDTPSESRSSFSKRFSSLTTSLGSLRLPSFRVLPENWSANLSKIWSEGAGVISLPIMFRLVGLIIIGLSVYLLFALALIPNGLNMSQHYDPEAVRARVQEEADPGRIAEYLRYITSFDHVAGTEGDLFLAKWMFDRWEASPLDSVEMLDYWVYLNYPRPDGRKVAIVQPPELAWTAALEEESALKDAGAQARQQTLSWHGSSRGGNVTGHLVYANGGSREDFRKLEKMGVNVKGSIALVRYHGTQHNPGLKVKAAEMAGAVGCLIYSDPSDDGFVMGETVPRGPWRPDDSVERASVGLSSWLLGDYLTPGWSSTLNSQRASKDTNPGLVNIPSLPLSWRDAQVLLKSLKGHGKPVDDSWAGPVSEVGEWWSGGDSAPLVWLQNLQDENEKQQMWNVRGKIEGAEAPLQRVIVGNHRDAWCFGAVDPGSGTAILAEIVNIFSTLRRLGWRPLRTIEFFSWDGGEYNMMGSTEYVEGDSDLLRKNAIAYLNVHAGVSGPGFHAAASPMVSRTILHVLDRVSDPLNNRTLKALWEENKSQIGELGYQSDYAPFQYMAGTSSLDIGFSGPKHGYPAHSCYDTYQWIEKFGDPTFEYHKTLAQIWALLILDMADRPIIPFDIIGYAKVVKVNAEKLVSDLKDMKIDSKAFHEAAELLEQNAEKLHRFEDQWTSEVLARGGFEINAMTTQRYMYNQRLLAFESNLLDLPGMFPGDKKEKHGIPGREQYKHVVYGPTAWSSGSATYFPAVRDMMESKDENAVQQQLDKAARIMHRAAEKLLSDGD